MVLVKNHHGKQKWISGKVSKKISDRTYIIDIGNREIKRHVDHLVLNRGNTTLRQCNEDISWDLNLDNHTDHSVAVPTRKHYPQRIRNPVKYYGFDD